VHRGELSVDRQTTERLLATISRSPPTPGRSSEEEKIASLTARERDIVLSLMRQPQLPLKEVAGSRGISERTLRNHLSSIYEKLGVSGRLELYVFSSKHGLDKHK
jgi:DNA-binding CsgD family transcriptional regulator